jgi:hypothetical protein
LTVIPRKNAWRQVVKGATFRAVALSARVKKTIISIGLLKQRLLITELFNRHLKKPVSIMTIIIQIHFGQSGNKIVYFAFPPSDTFPADM